MDNSINIFLNASFSIYFLCTSVQPRLCDPDKFGRHTKKSMAKLLLLRVRPCFLRPSLDGTYNKFSVFERLHYIELAGNCRSRPTLLQPQSSLTQRSRDSGSGEDTPAAKQLPSRLVPALLTWCHNNPSQNTALTLTSIVYLILFFLFLDFHSRAKCILYSL